MHFKALTQEWFRFDFFNFRNGDFDVGYSTYTDLAKR